MTDPIARTEPIARVDGLRVRRAAFDVGELSFEIPRGAVVGLVGPNGAGKTTTIRALLGLIRPDAGTVAVLGSPAGDAAALARTGVVLDRPTAAPDWRVDTLGSRLAPFYPVWEERVFRDLCDRLGVPLTQKVGELSRGQGVTLGVATALAHAPELLVLDEPSSGLDPAARRAIADLVREFVLDPSHAVLFSTHLTAELHDLADLLVVVAGGRIVRQGPLLDVVEEFAMARGSGQPPAGTLGVHRSGAQWSALIPMADSARFGPEVVIDEASIDDIVVHLAAQREGVAA